MILPFRCCRSPSDTAPAGVKQQNHKRETERKQPTPFLHQITQHVRWFQGPGASALALAVPVPVSVPVLVPGPGSAPAH